MGHHVMNGMPPVQVKVAKVERKFPIKVVGFLQNPMVNQGQNHLDSPANMLQQQQASYEVSFFHFLFILIKKSTEKIVCAL